MKNVNDYDSFLNEYYKGKNKAVGFQYSVAEDQINLVFSIASDQEINGLDVEENLTSFFDENLDEYNFELIRHPDEIRFKHEILMVSRGEYSPLHVWSCILDFDAYSESEVYSLLDTLMKKYNEFIILPFELNGEPIEQFKYLPKSKNKIGY